VLVDADLRFGDANILLDLQFERSIIDLLPHMDQLDSSLLDQVLAKHPCGLQLLMRPERPELAERVSAAHIEKVLTVLPRLFDHVVIDCEVSYDEKLLAVLDRVDTIFLIITPNLGVVHNAKHFLGLAEALGYPRDKIHIVLNRANSNVGLTSADVERALGPGQYFYLKSYGQLLTTGFNLGQPSVLAQPRSEFTRAMREMAEFVIGQDGTNGASGRGGLNRQTRSA
jgi:pilus assembly protein CpaE